MPEKNTSLLIESLRTMFEDISGLELAILIGSRTTGAAGSDSDWDVAIQWDRTLGFLEQLDATETLRKRIAEHLAVSEQLVDLIDLPTARLAMRAVIADEGVVIKGGDTLAWHRFLQRTWRELEEYYWDETYAA